MSEVKAEEKQKCASYRGALKRIAAGLCRRCGLERGAEGTKQFCRPCADKHAEYMRGYTRRGNLP